MKIIAIVVKLIKEITEILPLIVRGNFCDNIVLRIFQVIRAEVLACSLNTGSASHKVIKVVSRSGQH